MVKKHRYLIFSAHYLPYLGGIPFFTYHLAKALRKRGDEVTIVTPRYANEKPYEISPEGIKIMRLPTYAFMAGRFPLPKKNKEYCRMYKELLVEDFDRVLVNARFYIHSLEGLRFARKKQLPVLFLEHGSSYLTFNNAFLDKIEKVYERFLTACEKRGGAHFAAVSRRAASWLKEFDIHTSYVVHNAIDAPSYRKQKSSRDFRTEFGIPANSFLVVHNGRLLQDKGSLLVIEAAKAFPDVFFLIAGEGNCGAQIQAAAHKLKNLLYVGKISPQDVSRLLSQANAFILPSRTEGLPSAILEASAWGIPSLVTNVGGIEEIYSDLEKDGYFFCIEPSINSIKEKMSILLSKKEKPQACSSNSLAKRIDKAFSWKKSAEELDGVFACIEKERQKEQQLFKKAFLQTLEEVDYQTKIVPQMQEVLRDLLKVFDRSVKALGLTYWIDAGTLLGAVRHKGFIPWDDDIDVGMTLEDWKIYQAKAADVLPPGYSLLSMKNTKHFPLFWCTLVKDSTFYVSEEQEQAGYISGVFIDIFPYACLERDFPKRKRQRRALQVWQGLSYLKEIKVPTKYKGTLLAWACRLAHYFCAICLPRKYINRKFWEAVLTKNPSNEWTNLSYAGWPSIPSKNIFPLTSLSFDGINVSGPAEPQKYLDRMYDNWRKIPDPQERHFHPPKYIGFGDSLYKPSIKQPSQQLNTGQLSKTMVEKVPKAPEDSISPSPGSPGFEQSLKNPFFSIIIPVYNAQEYIERCLNSLLKQSFKSFEIIVVDDGSTDSSPQIIKEIQKRDSRLIFVQQKNAGTSAARNKGLEKARGDYITFVDNDDWWLRNDALSDIWELIKKNEPDCIFHTSYLKTASVLKPPVVHVDVDYLNADDVRLEDKVFHLIKEGAMSRAAWCKVIKQSVLQDNKIYFPEGMRNEDTEWTAQVLWHIKSLNWVSKPFYVYQKENQNAQTAKPTSFESYKDLTNILEKNLALVIEYFSRRQRINFDSLKKAKEVSKFSRKIQFKNAVFPSMMLSYLAYPFLVWMGLTGRAFAQTKKAANCTHPAVTKSNEEHFNKAMESVDKRERGQNGHLKRGDVGVSSRSQFMPLEEEFHVSAELEKNTSLFMWHLLEKQLWPLRVFYKLFGFKATCLFLRHFVH